jgi:hypothetical protein
MLTSRERVAHQGKLGKDEGSDHETVSYQTAGQSVRSRAHSRSVHQDQTSLQKTVLH